ncbi:MAG: cation-translocating P-type ATPase [Desulfobacteraceae bacterium]|nr:cation-translocating P-type ATPase [Desulfobacteraceae bacterium]
MVYEILMHTAIRNDPGAFKFFRGGLHAQDKLSYIQRLQAPGRCVMMVGDGMNDASALALFDLAVAVHNESALAREAADITLLRGSPVQLIEFAKWSQSVKKAFKC